MRNTFFIFFSLILIFSCSNKHNERNIEFKKAFDNKYFEIYKAFLEENKYLEKPFYNAILVFLNLLSNNIKVSDSILVIVDYSKPSNQNRFFVIDLKTQKVLKKEKVSHGKNTGNIRAKKFSNKPGSHQSSLGAYLTKEKYHGKHGVSLRLDGLEKRLNSNARKRAIVIHGAKYATIEFIKKHGRLGRSWGCPALPPDKVENIIDLIKNKKLLYIYGNESELINKSNLLNYQKGLEYLENEID